MAKEGERKEFIVGREDEGKRLDLFLSSKLSEFTRSKIQKLIKEKKVSVSGRFEKSGYKVKKGERIEVIIPEKVESGIIPENIPIRILYEDEDIVVIDKPSGMVVHPGAGVERGTIVNALLFHRPEIANVGSEKRPGIVHRLDKETSGVMVVAKNDFSYHFLQKEFKDRRVKKEYIAVVKCNLKVKKGVIELPIGRDKRDRTKISIRTKKPKEAYTEYEVIREINDLKILSVKPATGRTHQIRVHLKAIGCPILGDKKYGGHPHKRLALHSYSLAFIHPSTGKEIKFVSPLPSDFI
jgi:23S rRNA pseudouridine1911/1915/1917 synthase